MNNRTWCLFLSLLVSCSTPTADVAWVEKTHRTLAEHNMSANNAFLSELTNAKHLYAVGPVSNLDGEITVLDGKCYISQLDQKMNARVQEDCSLKAPYLLYGHFPKWRPIKGQRKIERMPELARQIPEILNENGANSMAPAAFLMEATLESVDYLIAQRFNTERLRAQDKQVTLLGFYLPKERHLHVHFLSADRSSSGHVEDFIIKPGTAWRMQLPTN